MASKNITASHNKVGAVIVPSICITFSHIEL
jgi:hypothetical protein